MLKPQDTAAGIREIRGHPTISFRHLVYSMRAKFASFTHRNRHRVLSFPRSLFVNCFLSREGKIEMKIFVRVDPSLVLGRSVVILNHIFTECIISDDRSDIVVLPSVISHGVLSFYDQGLITFVVLTIFFRHAPWKLCIF